MIYMVFRQNRDFLLGSNYAGLSYLGGCEGAVNNEYTVYNSGGTQVKIYSSPNTVDTLMLKYGSGVRIFTDSTNLNSRHRFLDIATHEHGHYFFGNGHKNYSKMSYGGGNHSGWEFSLSPWESIKLGYIKQKIVNYSNPVFHLYDISSRGGVGGDSGQVLQVPISSDGNQFFLLANRRKVSDWDRRMGGDTLATKNWEYLKDLNPEYGKGLYIYHIKKNGYAFIEDSESGDADLECADGLWSWEYAGVSRPLAFKPDSTFPVMKKKYPAYSNDVTDQNCADEMSVGFNMLGRFRFNLFSPGSSDNFSSSTRGTASLYTNNNDYWYSFAIMGDRWDAWNTGYNEVFSPWSSPNTKDTNNNQTDIYIWYRHFDNSTKAATIEVYRVGENSETEFTILRKTPPSRPMGVRVLSCDSTPTIGGYPRIKLRWFQNMEPDMESAGNKKYKIYCNTSINLSVVPPDAMQYSQNFYQLIATVTVPSNSIPEYIDSFKISSCWTQAGIADYKYPVRYRIQAIDKYDSGSVLSDFAKTEAWVDAGGEIGPDNIVNNENQNTPKEYKLSQNFPNPFNPVTSIQYDLPVDNFVTIKVYDLLGNEVMILVNEIKAAGSYIVSFNGNNLSSGIYYYKIRASAPSGNAGTFEQVRKMILVK
ncbi:MAG: T9SS type A sorting domain-containing protein [Ignavibacteria bacterium]